MAPPLGDTSRARDSIAESDKSFGVDMALTRCLRKVSNSLVLTIPSQVAEMVGFEEGMDVEVEAIGRESIRETRAARESPRSACRRAHSRARMAVSGLRQEDL